MDFVDLLRYFKRDADSEMSETTNSNNLNLAIVNNFPIILSRAKMFWNISIYEKSIYFQMIVAIFQFCNSLICVLRIDNLSNLYAFERLCHDHQSDTSERQPRIRPHCWREWQSLVLSYVFSRNSERVWGKATNSRHQNRNPSPRRQLSTQEISRRRGAARRSVARR